MVKMDTAAYTQKLWSPGSRVLVPTKKAITSVKVVTETATPACFMVWPNLSSRLAGVDENSTRKVDDFSTIIFLF